MVAKLGYDWSDLQHPPEIDAHSVAKHNVIRAYVDRYIRVLTADPRIDVLRVNFVDGFAGGGLYLHHGEAYLGSPLLLHKTVSDLEKAIQAERTKPFRIQARYFFVEQDAATVRALNHHLAQAGIKADGSNGAHVLHKSFVEVLPDLVSAIQGDGGQKRTVFLLDQYGYTDVPFTSLRMIFAALPHAEIILTFATDALINYMSTEPQFLEAVKRVGLGDAFTPESIREHQGAESRERRFAVEKILCEHIYANSGASYFTPFFIRSATSRRSYWLVHLSTHPKARDEMTGIHWKLTNHFCHHGKPGLNMLGFDPEQENLDQAVFDFYFDDNAERRTYDALVDELPGCLAFDKPITFGQLFAERCNQTPAHSDHMKRAVFDLQRMKVLTVGTPNGSTRRSASAIQADDVILPCRTVTFLPPR